ncbi:TolB family protein [Kribbella sp. CA-294648]|uniref:TolB family protein n=1 Tax=Kribbella sp. CA-294648 TaxID=3239948 RepID=UPI003D8B3BFD
MKVIPGIQVHKPVRTAVAVIVVAAGAVGAIGGPAAAGGDRQPGTISMVSVGPGGTGGDGASGANGTSGTSKHGRYVVFVSAATDLVANDTNGQTDVFVRDMVTARTTLASVGPGGVQGNAESREASISADGRYVAFDSFASNLVPGDTNDSPDVFRHDLLTGRTALASGGLQGPGDQGAVFPDISADGQHVAFQSSSTNLVPGDTNESSDIFVRNFLAGSTERVSLTSAGLQADWVSAQPAISGNGRVVAFDSNPAIQVRDRDKGTTRSVSDGVPGDPRSPIHNYSAADVSSDGRFVVFSVYSMLGSDQVANVWLRDLRTNRVQLVSADHLGKPATNFGGATGTVSADGRYVTFSTTGRTSPSDRGLLGDVYRLDRSSGTLVWVTHRQDQTNPWLNRIGSFVPAISDDGQHIAFDSDDTRLAGIVGPSGYEKYLWSLTPPS